MKGKLHYWKLLILVLISLWAWGCAFPAGSRPASSTTVPAASSSPRTRTLENTTTGIFSQLTLSSAEATDGGLLPAECTCDGSSSTLPLEWSGEPAGTKSFALIMYTIPAPNESHWYWVLYDIPATVHSLAKNSQGVGILGNNSVNGKTEYAPPCSKGPGAKLYTLTLYALSESPRLGVPPSQVSRDVLLAAIQNTTLSSASLNLSYTRQPGAPQ